MQLSIVFLHLALFFSVSSAAMFLDQKSDLQPPSLFRIKHGGKCLTGLQFKACNEDLLDSTQLYGVQTGKCKHKYSTWNCGKIMQISTGKCVLDFWGNMKLLGCQDKEKGNLLRGRSLDQVRIYEDYLGHWTVSNDVVGFTEDGQGDDFEIFDVMAELKTQGNKIVTTLNRLNFEIQAKEESLTQLNSQNDDLRKELQSKDETINSKEEKIETLNNEIQALNETIKESEQEVQRINSQLNESNEKVKELESDKATISSKDVEIGALNNEIQALNETIKESEQEVQRINSQLNESNEKVKELESDIKNRDSEESKNLEMPVEDKCSPNPLVTIGCSVATLFIGVLGAWFFMRSKKGRDEEKI